MFIIKQLRWVMAVCECAPYVSQVFSVELKPVLPYFLFWFLFPMDNFFSSSTVSFIAMEIAFVQTIPMPAWNERSGKKKSQLLASDVTLSVHSFGLSIVFLFWQQRVTDLCTSIFTCRYFGQKLSIFHSHTYMWLWVRNATEQISLCTTNF